MGTQLLSVLNNYSRLLCTLYSPSYAKEKGLFLDASPPTTTREQLRVPGVLQTLSFTIKVTQKPV